MQNPFGQRHSAISTFSPWKRPDRRMSESSRGKTRNGRVFINKNGTLPFYKSFSFILFF
jgi:hypothetical protein